MAELNEPFDDREFNEQSPVRDDFGGPVRPVPDTTPLGIVEFAEEVLPAAFRQENFVAAAFEGVFTSFPDDPTYNLADDPLAHDPIWNLAPDALADIGSAQQLAATHQRLLKELADREVLENANGFGQIAALMAGILSPENLLPAGVAGAAVRSIAKHGSKYVARNVRNAAFATASQTGIAEAILQKEQLLRSTEESAFAVGASVVLGGALGTIAGTLGVASARRAVREMDSLLEGPKLLGTRAVVLRMAEDAAANGEFERLRKISRIDPDDTEAILNAFDVPEVAILRDEDGEIIGVDMTKMAEFEGEPPSTSTDIVPRGTEQETARPAPSARLSRIRDRIRERNRRERENRARRGDEDVPPHVGGGSGDLPEPTQREIFFDEILDDLTRLPNDVETATSFFRQNLDSINAEIEILDRLQRPTADDQLRLAGLITRRDLFQEMLDDVEGTLQRAADRAAPPELPQEDLDLPQEATLDDGLVDGLSSDADVSTGRLTSFEEREAALDELENRLTESLQARTGDLGPLNDAEVENVVDTLSGLAQLTGTLNPEHSLREAIEFQRSQILEALGDIDRQIDERADHEPFVEQTRDFLLEQSRSLDLLERNIEDIEPTFNQFMVIARSEIEEFERSLPFGAAQQMDEAFRETFGRADADRIAALEQAQAFDHQTEVLEDFALDDPGGIRSLEDQLNEAISDQQRTVEEFPDNAFMRERLIALQEMADNIETLGPRLDELQARAAAGEDFGDARVERMHGRLEDRDPLRDFTRPALTELTERFFSVPERMNVVRTISDMQKAGNRSDPGEILDGLIAIMEREAASDVGNIDFHQAIVAANDIRETPDAFREMLRHINGIDVRAPEDLDRLLGVDLPSAEQVAALMDRPPLDINVPNPGASREEMIRPLLQEIAEDPRNFADDADFSLEIGLREFIAEASAEIAELDGHMRVLRADPNPSSTRLAEIRKIDEDASGYRTLLSMAQDLVENADEHNARFERMVSQVSIFDRPINLGGGSIPVDEMLERVKRKFARGDDFEEAMMLGDLAGLDRVTSGEGSSHPVFIRLGLEESLNHYTNQLRHWEAALERAFGVNAGSTRDAFTKVQYYRHNVRVVQGMLDDFDGTVQKVRDLREQHGAEAAPGPEELAAQSALDARAEDATNHFVENTTGEDAMRDFRANLEAESEMLNAILRRGPPDPPEPEGSPRVAGGSDHVDEDGNWVITRQSIEEMLTNKRPDQERAKAAMERKVKKAFGIERLLKNISPNLRLAINSKSAVVRMIHQRLAETSVHYEGNSFGIVNPISAENRIIGWNRELGEIVEELPRAWARYRLGRDPKLGDIVKLQLNDTLASRNTTDSPGKPVRDSGQIEEHAGSVPSSSVQLTYDEFLERIGYAMRRSDRDMPHNGAGIKEVMDMAEMVRTKLFNPTKKDAMLMGFFSEDFSNVKTAESYLTRIFNIRNIKANEGKFDQIVAEWLMEVTPKIDENGDPVVYTGQMALDDAARIRYRIVSTPRTRSPYDAMKALKIGPAKALQGRAFLIPDERIEGFLNNNIEDIVRFYTRTVVPDLEIARAFGTPEHQADFRMETVLARGNDLANPGQKPGSIWVDYQRMIDAAGSDSEKAALAKQRDADIRDLTAIRDILRGTYAAAADPDSLPVRARITANRFNYLVQGGTFLLSSLPDVGRVIMTDGISRVWGNAIKPMVEDWSQFRLAFKEAKLAGVAWDTVLNSRVNSLYELGSDPYARGSRGERALRRGADQFANLSLLSPWNTMLKQFSGVVIQARLGEAITQLDAQLSVLSVTSRDLRMLSSEGKTLVSKLSDSGIPLERVQEIAAEMRRAGVRGADHPLARGDEKSGLWNMKTEDWEDMDLVHIMRGAIRREVDKVIVTPGAGDRPLWMSTELGRLVGQYRSFSFAATQRVLIPGLQEPDRNFLNGVMLSVAMGMVATKLKNEQFGRGGRNDIRYWIAEGIDASGVTGILANFNQDISTLTKGAVRMGRLIGAPNTDQFTRRGFVSVLGGPTVSTLDSVSRVTQDLLPKMVGGDPPHRRDINAARRLWPTNQIFYLDSGYDFLEKGITDTLQYTRGE